MTLDLSDIIQALDDNPFEEIPADVVTFVTAPEYLGQPPLSEYQYTLVECMSQIYREEDLIRIHGEERGRDHFRKYTKVEVILQCGKGCHDPNTPTFDPVTGKWIPLASMKEGLIASMHGNEYATEPFYEGHGQMVRVKTSLGFEENVYIGHKYYWMKRNKFYKRLRDNNAGSFQEVRNIRVGDRIAIGLNMSPNDPINMPPEHAELIGYWLGDGMLPTDKNPMLNMDFCSSETESIENYMRLCKSIGDEPYRINHKNKNMVSFVHRKNSHALHLVKKYGIWGLRSKTKFIPDAVWKSNNDTLALTISRLWQTDGCIYEKNGMTAEYVSVSEQLAHDVHRALLRLGVPSSIRSRIPKSNFANASRAYYVTVTSQECFNAFSDRIHLLDHKAMKKLENRGKVHSRLDNNIYWDRIISIEPLEDGEYWTRTVPQSGHYIGNGFVSANSGKDHTSTIACAYIIYKLMCLKDPARYYGKPPDDAIDLINIAINAEQAKNVFFDNFVRKIKNSPWFAGKYDPKVNSVAFKKSITMYSGHSERESHEGLNLFLAILDEISGFASQSSANNEQAKTAENTYRAFRGSVDSRFPDFGKCISKDALLWTDNGLQTIGSLAEYTGNVMSGNSNAKKVFGFYDDGIKEGLKITNSHGISTDVTFEHKLYVRSRSGFEGWKLAKDITEDDFLAIKKGAIFGNNDLSLDDAYLLGLWVAEGSSFNINKNKYNQQVITLGAERFLMDSILNTMSDWRDRFSIKNIHNNKKAVSVKDRDKNFSYIRISGVSLEDNFKKYFGIESYNFKTKHVPKKVMGASSESICSFIKGLFDGDGYTCHRPEISIGSERLATEVSALLWGLGIDNTLRNKKTVSGNITYTVRVTNVQEFDKKIGYSNPNAKKYINLKLRTKTCKPIDYYIPGANDALNKIINWLDTQPGGRSSFNCQHIGRNIYNNLNNKSFRELTKQQAIRYINSVPNYISDNLTNLVNDEIIWSRVVRIEPSTNHRVDIEVDGDHSFIANGIINHNCVLLSFPRYKNDFIQQAYDGAIAEKETITRSHKFVLNSDLPEDDPTNTFEIEWEEDHILSYKYPKVFALKRPTWEVNPTRSIEDFKIAFFKEPSDALMRFACMPSTSSDAFFKSREKIEKCLSVRNPLDSFRRFDPSFKPDSEKIYYVHADLAQRHDKCAVAISHIEKWVKMQAFNNYEQIVPFVVVDAVAWWEPRVEGPVDLSEVKNWIISLRRNGFNLGIVTFDRWQSFDIQRDLRSVGINSETLSVAKKHYEDLAMLIYEERVAAPHVELLLDELLELRIMPNNRVDHPRKKSKDLADAMCGSVYNALSHGKRETSNEIEIHTWETVRTTNIKEEHEKKEIPEDIREFLINASIL